MSGAPVGPRYRDYWLDILTHNTGFTEPGNWVAYAERHGFQRVRARKLSSCPDCGNRVSERLAQYVHYSTLISLCRCNGCQLVYADTHIDANVIQRHFERAYKDEAYFMQSRESIFDHVVRLVGHVAPASGRVIDIGGAEGHLLAALRRRRPDLELVLSDISEDACAYAREKFGLRTLRMALPDLAKLEEKFDVVVMLDVLYYEPDVRGSWQSVTKLLQRGGMLILRLPNGWAWIALAQRLRELFFRSSIESQSSIRFFNPEHIFVFSKSYLRTRLGLLGFTNTYFFPSPLSPLRRHLRAVYVLYHAVANLVNVVTFRRVALTPSMLVVARKG